MRQREYRCSECLELQKEEMESPYVCEGCGSKDRTEYIFWNKYDNSLSAVIDICKTSGGLLLNGGKYGRHSGRIENGILMVKTRWFDTNYKLMIKEVE